MMRGHGEMPGECSLEVMASTTSTPEQLRLLMDLIPGFQYCDFDRLTGRSRLLMDLIPGFQYCDFDKLTGRAS